MRGEDCVLISISIANFRFLLNSWFKLEFGSFRVINSFPKNENFELFCLIHIRYQGISRVSLELLSIGGFVSGGGT